MAKKKPEKIKGTPVTGEEEYYIEFAREQEVKGPERLEEVSRWLVSIISVMTGVFGAGISMLGLVPSAGMEGLSLLPFVFFSASVLQGQKSW